MQQYIGLDVTNRISLKALRGLWIKIAARVFRRRYLGGFHAAFL